MNRQSNTNTETRSTKKSAASVVLVLMSVALSACVVVPSEQLGYRMTNSVLPTYVNGQYVGMQPSDYVPPSPTPLNMQSNSATSTFSTNSLPYQQSSQQNYQPSYQQTYPAPTYIQPPVSSVFYVQNPAPLYSYRYRPYYYPTYVDPWYGTGTGLALGLGIGLNSRRGCCWPDRGWRRGGWRHW